MAAYVEGVMERKQPERIAVRLGTDHHMLTRLGGAAISISVVILDGFSLYEFAAIADIFAKTNQVCSGVKFDVRVLSVTGREVMSSIGALVRPDGAVRDSISASNVFILKGAEPVETVSPDLFPWLRLQNLLGSFIFGIGDGAECIAKAGFLHGGTLAAHWSARDAWQELYSAISFSDSVYAKSGRVYSCAGYETCIDLLVRCVASVAGADIGRHMADTLNVARVRSWAERQGHGTLGRRQTGNRTLKRALHWIHSNPADTLELQDIAVSCNVSLRQLQRLFKRYVGLTVCQYNAVTRLSRARQLLARTGMSVTDVAIATGFRSLSHFSSRYRKCFGAPPREDRGELWSLSVGR